MFEQLPLSSLPLMMCRHRSSWRPPGGRRILRGEERSIKVHR